MTLGMTSTERKSENAFEIIERLTYEKARLEFEVVSLRGRIAELEAGFENK